MHDSYRAMVRGFSLRPQEPPQRVLVIGPRSSGKSSLINSLFRVGADLDPQDNRWQEAPVGSGAQGVLSTTWEYNAHDLGNLTEPIDKFPLIFYDTPGFDYQEDTNGKRGAIYYLSVYVSFRASMSHACFRALFAALFLGRHQVGDQNYELAR
jgi:predicted GTPase